MKLNLIFLSLMLFSVTSSFAQDSPITRSYLYLNNGDVLELKIIHLEKPWASPEGTSDYSWYDVKFYEDETGLFGKVMFAKEKDHFINTYSPGIAQGHFDVFKFTPKFQFFWEEDLISYKWGRNNIFFHDRIFYSVSKGEIVKATAENLQTDLADCDMAMHHVEKLKMKEDWGPLLLTGGIITAIIGGLRYKYGSGETSNFISSSVGLVGLSLAITGKIFINQKNDHKKYALINFNNQ